MPEAQIILGHLTTYLACSPKSNASYVALKRALEDARTKPLPPIPMHLRNAPHSGIYQYPHDDPRGLVEQQYMPDGDWSLPYYEPTAHGAEGKIRIKRPPADADGGQEQEAKA
jgi:putative ATPase